MQIFKMYFSTSLSIVVALSKNRVIGKNNTLPWHLPIDLKHFKNITWGMPIIMGKNTYYSLKKPLQGRYNIIVSKHLKDTSDNIIICRSVQEAIEVVHHTLHCKQSFIIGGNQLYESTIHMVDNIYCTRIDTNCQGDTFFPTFEDKTWTLQHQVSHKANINNPYDCIFEHWKK
ncbi:MAG: dihydrofolate reductase [Chitinophagaceae bacterium]